MLPSVITGGLPVVLTLSLTHSAARREDSSVPALALTDCHRRAAIPAAPKGRVADKARHPADEVLHVLPPLLEEIEQLRGPGPDPADSALTNSAARMWRSPTQACRVLPHPFQGLVALAEVADRASCIATTEIRSAAASYW